MQIEISAHAKGQIRQAAEWWHEHRNKAPNAFSDDLEKAFQLIRNLPSIGQSVPHKRLRGLRRLLLGRVQYYLYYVPDRDNETLSILALWHTSREGEPGL